MAIIFFAEIEIPNELERYVIKEGSVAVDGISLTIAKLSGNKIGLSIIPHTWNETNLKSNRTGGSVNIEVDVIAKYVEKTYDRQKTEKII